MSCFYYIAELTKIRNIVKVGGIGDRCGIQQGPVGLGGVFAVYIVSHYAAVAAIAWLAARTTD